MKPTLTYLAICLSLFLSFSCSKDSKENEENLKAVDLLVGSWDFQSEHRYDCTTNEILIERFASEDIIVDVVFNEDGTFIDRDGPGENNGNTETGTWERISETTYRFKIESPDPYTYDAVIGEDIKFENDNVLINAIWGCNESSPDAYDAVRWVRMN